jgi:hypothetical protein
MRPWIFGLRNFWRSWVKKVILDKYGARYKVVAALACSRQGALETGTREIK